MKLTKIFRVFVFAGLLSAIAYTSGSCDDDNKSIEIGLGTLTGMVTNEDGTPLADVIVSISGIEETATTGNDGKYRFTSVPKESHAVIFSKSGYQTISLTVTPGKFNSDSQAAADIVMIKAAIISGTVTDAKNNGGLLSGVKVSVNPAIFTTTGDDGTFVIEGLAVNDYEVTFSKTDYATVTKKIKKTDFVDGKIAINILMGDLELLRGKTASDLQNAEKWYYSEYRGGGNADNYPHWDWACDYMCALDFWGSWAEQWEGTTLQIRNNQDEQKEPADLEMFDSYVYGSKKITPDNKILSLRIRTHDASEAAPVYFGVQIVDLSQATPVTEKVGETKTYGSGNYADFHFDLSKYVGKEVIVAIGIYRKETGNYWKQLVLRRIAFAQENVVNYDWVPGTEVIDGWKLTQEMVRSSMCHTKKSFTGISPIKAGRDVDMQKGYPAAYRAWIDVNHIAANWSFVPLKKDPEVFPSEGYIIKTRANEPADTKVPESYFYAKFSIATGSNELTFKTRNFGSNYTFFKLTAIQDNGTVTHIAPKSNTAQEALAADNGCWKFKHNAGGASEPESYASFVYDLSEFNGTDVVLVLGVYKGEQNGDENKLVLYNIDLK